jgi:hypothetical protein
MAVLLMTSHRLVALPLEPITPLIVMATTGCVMLCNLSVFALLVVIRGRILQPWRRMAYLLRHGTAVMAAERGSVSFSLLNLRYMASELARFASNAEDAYRKCQSVERELQQSRRLLAQVLLQQQTIIASTNREIIEQYRSVLSYANYLDEHIQRQRDQHHLRYDFDDVCESGFNLKLIAQSLELMRRNAAEYTVVPLSNLLQQTLIALAPSLERRSMKLSTLGVDEGLNAHTDMGLIAHALWMMLLGMIRYAAAESTLRLRCLPADDGSEAIISIVVSELEPGQMTPDERHAHLVRQIQDATPHMFAETIRLHANVQLAELMLASVGGRVSILPLTSYACEIALILPIAKKGCSLPQGL